VFLGGILKSRLRTVFFVDLEGFFKLKKDFFECRVGSKSSNVVRKTYTYYPMTRNNERKGIVFESLSNGSRAVGISNQSRDFCVGFHRSIGDLLNVVKNLFLVGSEKAFIIRRPENRIAIQVGGKKSNKRVITTRKRGVGWEKGYSFEDVFFFVEADKEKRMGTCPPWHTMLLPTCS
jgi:hypothetical protein